MSQTNIVLSTCGRPVLLAQTLNTLLKNTRDGDYTLTIVEDGTEDFQISDIPNTVLLRIMPRCGITGRVRNLGIYFSEKHFGRGDYLYLSDNDVAFLPQWLETLIEYQHYGAEYGVALVGGWNHPYMQPRRDDGFGVNIAGGRYTVMTHDAVSGASMLMRWETYDKYGPFDSWAPGVGQSEDVALCQKIIADGNLVGSIYPRVVLNAGVTNTLGQLSPGADFMVEELKEAKKRYAELYWE